jgi:hypothetical protein
MRSLMFGACLALACLVGCKGQPSQQPAPSGEAQLSVKNQAFSDMVIYVVQSSRRVRLGEARGLSTTLLTIPSSLVSPAGMLQFVASPIGSSQVSASQQLSVRPGDIVEITIPPN